VSTLTKGARGEACTLQIAGVCRDERDTVVACHISPRDGTRATGMKVSDLLSVYGCARCHDVMDGRDCKAGSRSIASMAITREDYWYYANRALGRTTIRRSQQGLIVIPGDK